jgi:branched-chain amino acid transport system ATP-binding protein
VLTLSGITAGYGETTVLRDVSLTVPQSSVAALLGPNGAGKTTTLRVASGLLRPTHGRVLLDGEDVTGKPPHELVRRGVCLIPEGRGIFRSLTVRENLLLHADPGDESAALDLATEEFGVLGDRLDQLAGTLSGGEQQMLALARAYVQRPKLVLLDEVSMGLAPLIVEQIFGFIGRLAASGTALLLVEQYVSQALRLADYVYVMSRGSLVFQGDAGELERDDVFARYLGTDAAVTTG